MRAWRHRSWSWSATDRARWALIDQLLSSGTNFAVGLLLARVLGAEEFGRFALAFAIWLVVMAVHRALLVQPYTLVASPASPEARAGMTASACWASLLFGGVAGSLLIPVALLAGSNLRGSLLALTVAMPGLVVQDLLRFAAFARGEPRRAAAIDGVWAVGQAVLLVSLWASGDLRAASGVGAWGLGALAGAIWGIRQLGLVGGGRHQVRSWLGEVLPVGRWFAASEVVFAIGSQSAAIVVAGVVGPAGVGGLRAASNLLAPTQLVAMAADANGLPAAARARSAGAAALRAVAIRYSLGLFSIAAAYGVVLVALSRVLLTNVFGATFAPFADLVPPVVLANLAGAASVGATLGLRAAAGGRTLTGLQLVASAAKIVGVLVLVGPFGVVGAAWGVAMGSVLHGWLLWLTLLRETDGAAGGP